MHALLKFPLLPTRDSYEHIIIYFEGANYIFSGTRPSMASRSCIPRITPFVLEISTRSKMLSFHAAGAGLTDLSFFGGFPPAR